MAINTDDICEVIFNYSSFGIQAKMVQYYQFRDKVGTWLLNPENAICEAMYQQFTENGALLALANTAYFDGITLKNVSGGIYEGSYLSPAIGEVASSHMGSFTAGKLVQKRATTITRSGFKRVPFIPESQGGTNIWSVNATAFDVFQQFFGTGITLVNPNDPTATWYVVPVIVGRQEITPSNYALDLSRVNEIAEAVNGGLTTQNSRKA